MEALFTPPNTLFWELRLLCVTTLAGEGEYTWIEGASPSRI